MISLGILISGRGSNFQAIARAIETEAIPARIAIVISNRDDAHGLEIARQMGLPNQTISSRGRSREDFEDELLAALSKAGAEHVCLAGFMRVLSAHFVRGFKGLILNIHPSLLPAFPGVDAQQQALDYGVKITGCTVHLIDEGVDTGPVVLQAAVPVLEGDTVQTLSQRILEHEHQIYPQAVRLLAEGRLQVAGRRVVIAPKEASGRPQER